ncbi:uncharacterized protein L201_002386 [Kwoniella dendrophila CBS 6074]|uniref:Uncharacterized protein n=1 Tax=Kwoniella dendrophila CBS 6074 TaxID=1295534 RepID=A0AAX4JQ12_9TREE
MDLTSQFGVIRAHINKNRGIPITVTVEPSELAEDSYILFDIDKQGETSRGGSEYFREEIDVKPGSHAQCGNGDWKVNPSSDGRSVHISSITKDQAYGSSLGTGTCSKDLLTDYLTPNRPTKEIGLYKFYAEFDVTCDPTTTASQSILR